MIDSIRLTAAWSWLMGALVASTSIASPQSESFLNQPVCRNFVRHDDGQILLGTNSGLVLIDIDGTSHPYELGETPRDALIFGNEIIVLVGTKIVTLSRALGTVTGQYETQDIKSAPSLLPQETPRAIGRIDQTLLVAHGTLGVALFDLESHRLKRIVDINRGQKIKGMAQDITAQNHSVYVLVDNYQMDRWHPSQEFRGFVQIDVDQEAELARFGGLDPGSTAAAWYKNTLLLSFAGMPIWRLAMPLAGVGPLSDVAHPVTDFGRDGHSVGHLDIDDEFVWTCHRSSNRSTNVPALYPRTALGL